MRTQMLFGTMRAQMLGGATVDGVAARKDHLLQELLGSVNDHAGEPSNPRSR